MIYYTLCYALQGPMGLRGEPGRPGEMGKSGAMVRPTHS